MAQELGMLNADRKIIQRNFQYLIDNTDIDLLIPKLVEKQIFSATKVKKFSSSDALKNKRLLFLDIDTRGPDAFNALIDAFKETGQYEVADKLLIEKNTNVEIIGKVIPTPIRREASLFHEAFLESEQNYDIPLEIKVLHSETFLDDSNPPYYKTRSKNRGKVFILNNIDFRMHERRRGAVADAINLKELFSQMGLEVIYHENKTCQDMKTIIKAFASDSSLRHFDMAIFVFMSHGNINKNNESVLLGTDEKELKTWWIEQQFSNECCVYLKNKPKFFVYQMCRTLTGAEDQSIEPSFSANWNEMRYFSDILIAHCTLPGLDAYRDIERGSWYIEKFCKVFMEHAHNKPLESLLKLVDIELKKLRTTGLDMQTPMYQVCSFKNCYIHPGIYEDEHGNIRKFTE